jgi:S-phase kinase-associated protein 1
MSKVTFYNAPVDETGSVVAGFDPATALRIEVPRDVAMESEFVKDLLEDFGERDAVVAVNGNNHRTMEESFKLMEKIVEIKGPKVQKAPVVPVVTVDKPAEGAASVEEVKEDEMIRDEGISQEDKDKNDKVMNYISSVTNGGTDKDLLFNMTLLLNKLAAKRALQFTCKFIASLIKGKTPEQIRAEFAIPESAHISSQSVQ